jgi:4'-phosphopantetheinyl transferase
MLTDIIKITRYFLTAISMKNLLYASESCSPIPAPGEVHIRYARLENVPEKFECILSRDEKDRTKKLLYEKDRRNYTACHGILRVLLGRYLKTTPGTVRITSGRNGKPELAGEFGSSGLFFNISHSEGLALFAFSQERAIGVDIEYMGNITDFEKIADRFFSPGERLAMRISPDSERKETFFTIWTRKEALVKATGEGVSDYLNEVDTSSIACDSTRGNIIYKNSTWFIKDLNIDEDYRVVFVSRKKPINITCFDWRNHYS